MQLHLNSSSPGDKAFVSQVHCYIFRPRHWKVEPKYKPHCTLATNRKQMIPCRGQAQFEFSVRLEVFHLFVSFAFPRCSSFLITFLHRKFSMALYVDIMVVIVWRGLKALSDFLEEH